MAKIYRLNQANTVNKILVNDFRYTEQERIIRRSVPINPIKDVIEYYKSEDDVITEWAGAARESLEGSGSDGLINCWDGHYEQFGVVIMSLANIASTGKGWNGRWIEAMEAYVKPSHAQEVLCWGPYTSSASRAWYRAWFNLIGHPQFRGLEIMDVDALRYRSYECALIVAYWDLEDKIRTERSLV